MVTPVPVLELGGVDVAAGPHADGSWPDLMALDGASVTWGRAAPLEQPTPSTATVRLLDPTGSWAARTDPLIGATVRLRWTWNGEERVYFTGRVAAVEVAAPRRYRSPVGRALPGTIVTLSCTSLLVDLANRPGYVTTAGGVGAESLAARRARFVEYTAPQVTGIDTRPAWDLVPLAASYELDPGSLLDTLTAFLVNAGGDRWTYDPHTRRIDWLGRRTVDPAAVARLAPADAGHPGVHVTGPTARRAPDLTAAPALTIPADVVEYDGGVSRDQTTAITRVELKWLSFTGYDTDTGGSTYAEATYRHILPVNEATVGVRALGVQTQITDVNAAQNASYDVADLVYREGSGWLLEPMTWDTTKTGGFPTIDHARLLLAGREQVGVYWLAGSWLAAAGIRPLFGVMGGTITYAAGGWIVEWQPAPTSTSGPAPDGVAWEDLDPSLVWADDPGPAAFDDSVTYEDLAFVASGTIGS
jgi:hypothetical protein